MIVTGAVAVQCDVGVSTVDGEVQCETHGENPEAWKANFAKQCDFDSHEDYNLASGQMALLTGLVGKKQLNGKLGWLERPVNNSRQRWWCSSPEKKQWYRQPQKLGPSATERAWEHRHKPHGADGPWSCAAVSRTRGHVGRREYGVGVRTRDREKSRAEQRGTFQS